MKGSALGWHKRKPRYYKLSPEMTDAEILSMLYVNRSITNQSLNNSRQAVLDATQALYLDIHNEKAFITRGNVSISMRNFRYASEDFREALTLNSESGYVKKRMEYALSQIKCQELLEELEDEMYTPPVVTKPPQPKKVVNIPQPPEQEQYEKIFDFDNFTAEDAKEVMQIVKTETLLSHDCMVKMLMKIRDIMSPLPNIVNIDGVKQVKVVGDTHGQLQDLLFIFENFGYPCAENPYLFNGDFVDRGSQGLEILMVLFAWKIAEPEGIYLNRGNHETDFMNTPYGFRRECESKLGADVFAMCSKVFELLPLGHIIGKKAFVVHGGLFSDPSVTVNDIQRMNRVGQPPESGPLNDILWADPMEDSGIAPSPRGGTILFGPDVTESFLKRNGLEVVIRSHQVMDNGYGIHQGGKCVTIFSAPNYIGRVGNKGAICYVMFEEDGKMKPLEFKTFEARPVPKSFVPMLYTDLIQYM